MTLSIRMTIIGIIVIVGACSSSEEKESKKAEPNFADLSLPEQLVYSVDNQNGYIIYESGLGLVDGNFFAGGANPCAGNFPKDMSNELKNQLGVRVMVSYTGNQLSDYFSRKAPVYGFNGTKDQTGDKVLLLSQDVTGTLHVGNAFDVFLENALDSVGAPAFWSGSEPNGTISTYTCQDWTQNSETYTGQQGNGGNLHNPTHGWLSAQSQRCGNGEAYVYCVAQKK